MPRLARIGAAASGAFGLPNDKPSFISVNYLIVGGTGSGGTLTGGGGGGGQVKQNTFSLSTSTIYLATVGASTGSSAFNAVTSAGGVSGQNRDPADSTGINGGASGSGNAGGTGARIYFAPYDAPFGSGGGGGQGAVGGDGSAVDSPPYTSGVYTGGNGGVGVAWTITGVYYGGGQGGGADAGTHGTANGGASGTGYNAFGSLSGGVIISYVFGLQLYTGGTITSSGTGPTKRWFHTFTSSANLVPKVY
jgi:hypothetical protein